MAQNAINDNLELNAPKPLDNRSGTFSAGIWKPFVSTTEALNTIVVQRRYEGMILPIRKEGTANKLDLYWFEGGIADENLTLIETGGEPAPEIPAIPINITLAQIQSLKTGNSLAPYTVYNITDAKALVIARKVNTFYPQVYYNKGELNNTVYEALATLISDDTEIVFPSLRKTDLLDPSTVKYVLTIDGYGRLVPSTLENNKIALLTDLTPINSNLSSIASDITALNNNKVNKETGKGLIDVALVDNLTGFPVFNNTDGYNYDILERSSGNIPEEPRYRWSKRFKVREVQGDVNHFENDDIIIFNLDGSPEIGDPDFRTVYLQPPTNWPKPLILKNASSSFKLYINSAYPLRKSLPKEGESTLIEVINPGEGYMIMSDGSYIYSLFSTSDGSGGGPITPQYPIIPFTDGAPVISGPGTTTGGSVWILQQDYERPLKIVIMGDSHAEGLNYPVPLSISDRLYTRMANEQNLEDSAYNNVYTFSVEPTAINSNGKNIAKFNYYSAQWMPNGDNGAVDTERNITKALSFAPDIIFAVFSSNEPNFGVSTSVAVARFKAMFDLAKSQGVRMVFTGTYPRSNYNTTQQQQLLDINEALKEAVGEENVLDVMSFLRSNTGVAQIKSEYNHDTVHINGEGNQLVSNAFFDWIKTQTGINNIVSYEIQRSINGVSGWTYYNTVTTHVLPSLDMVGFYRFRNVYNTGNKSPWSEPYEVVESNIDAPVILTDTVESYYVIESPANLILLNAEDSEPGGDDATITSYQWEEVSGNMNYSFRTFDNPSVVSPGNASKIYIRPVAIGAYRVRITVTNSIGLQSTKTIEFSIVAAPNNVLERFEFGPTGTPTTSGWTAVRGEPAASTTPIVVTGLGGSGITVQNHAQFTGNGGVSAFQNGFASGILYLDDNGVQQTVPQSAVLGCWSEWSNGSKGITLKNVPLGNYKLRIWGSLIQIGGFNNNTSFCKFEVIGSTSVTSINYGYSENTDDRTDGIIINISPNNNNEIRINMIFGDPISGVVIASIISALELKSI